MSVSAPRPEFVVFAPPYDPNVGGYIALHYLCHLLNEVGYKAHLVPLFSSAEISPIDPDSAATKVLEEQRDSIRKSSYKVNAAWNTPIYRRPWRGIAKRDDLVVVYPEVVFGNPLRAKNVARWLLHDPGFHNKQVYFVPGEVHFRFGGKHKPVEMPWISVSDQLLTVLSIPWEHYREPPANSPRSGTAYLLRKGQGKPIIHDLTNSVQIDGMSHAEVGKIFRRVQSFISYDTRTTYSTFALLAGAKSIIIPDDGVTEEQWEPDPELRAGFSYGLEPKNATPNGRQNAVKLLSKMELQSVQSVLNFAQFWDSHLLKCPKTDQP